MPSTLGAGGRHPRSQLEGVDDAAVVEEAVDEPLDEPDEPDFSEEPDDFSDEEEPDFSDEPEPLVAEPEVTEEPERESVR